MAEIYGLLDPDTNELRYIGKANDSQKRLRSHLRDMRVRNTPLYCWMRKLSDSGKIPLVEVLLVTNNWEADECSAIEIARNEGARLLNIADGGNQPYCSKEQRAINGRRNAKKLHADPAAKHMWRLKKGIAENMRFFKKHNKAEIYNRLLDKLQTAARSRPDVFGDYLLLKHI